MVNTLTILKVILPVTTMGTSLVKCKVKILGELAVAAPEKSSVINYMQKSFEDLVMV